jgi:predicted ATPase
MDENDANVANISELQEHISLAAARARTLTGEPRAESLTDLQDYYERMIQIRKYTIETLQETAKEVARAHRATLQKWKLFAVFVVLVFAGVVGVYAPHVVHTATEWAAPYATVDRVASNVFVAGVVLFFGNFKRAFK